MRRFLRGRIPAYVDGALNIVDADDVARGHLLADERGEVGERYILGNRNFTLDRLFADLARLSGVEPPALKLPLPAALALAPRGRARCPAGRWSPSARCAPASLWWAYRSTKAKRELGWKPSHHEDTLADDDRLVPRARARRLRPPGHAPAARAARRRLRRAHGRRAARGAARLMSARCTAAARRPTGCARAGASRASCAGTGSTFEEVRVAWRRRDRDEVAELSGQRHVPLLVIEGEAICDSHRIVEHLRWRAGRATRP